MVSFTQGFTITSGESPEGTTVTTIGPIIYASPSTGQSASTGLVKFALNGLGQVVRDGAADLTTTTVKELYYHNHTVYQRNLANDWFAWNTAVPTWQLTTSPKELWNRLNKNIGLALTDDELTATASLVTTDQTVYGTRAVLPGLLNGIYWEAIVVMTDAAFPNIGIGTVNSLVANSFWVGQDQNSVGWHPNGNIFYNFIVTAAPTGVVWGSYQTGDRLSLALDTVHWTLWGRVNNGLWNASPTANPVTNVGGFQIAPIMQTQGILPGVSLWTNTDTVSAFFERSDWRFLAPTGFQPWSELITSPPIALHYGTTPPPTIANLTGNQSPLGWTIELFDDFTTLTESTTDFTLSTATTTWTQGLQTNYFSQSQEMVVGRYALQQAGIVGAATPFLSGGRSPYSLRNGTILQMTAFPATPAEVTALRAFGQGYQVAPAQTGGPAILTGSLTSMRAIPTSAADALTKGYKRHGYWEVNCKWPTGANADPSGLWSGFWLSLNQPPTFLPRIDVFSQDGPPTAVDSYFDWVTGRGTLKAGPIGTTNFSAAFHTFGLLWTPNYIGFYIDGNLIGSYLPTLPIPALGSAAMAFETAGTFGDGYFGPNSPMSMVLQFSCGWYWTGGHFVTATQLPATFEIDWVRYSALGPA